MSVPTDDPRYSTRGGMYVPPGEGTTQWLVGDTYTFKADAKSTNGSLTFVEASVPPGAGAQPHVHGGCDEAFYMMSGELEFLNGDEKITAGPGAFFFVPRGTRHRFFNRGLHPAKMLFLFTPGGIEEIFYAAGEQARPGEQPAGSGLEAPDPRLMERYAVEFLPDPES